MEARLLLAVLITTLVGVGKVHADPGACSAYARTAVAQNEESLRKGCGFNGNRWQSNYDAHYGWCMANIGYGREGPSNENAARAADLAKCQPRENADARCQDYARTAVRQNTDNQQRRCGFSGARWQSNFSAHFEWCKGAGKSEADNEQAARVSDLARCVTAVEPGNDMVYCRQHARLAVAEYNENIRRGCGISGPGWSPDEEGHYQWCMHNGRADADAWHNGRMQSLSHCNPTVPVNPARGYQLFFDGTLVSGPDAANYSLDDAKRNCAYNMYNRPKVKVVCRYNGQDMMIR